MFLNPFESIDMPFAVETVYNDPAAIWGDDVARRPGKGKGLQSDGSTPESDTIPVDRKIFAVNLIRARTAAGMTQTELAKSSGLGQSHISELERGNWEPRLSTIMALADALRVEPSELLPNLDRKSVDIK